MNTVTHITAGRASRLAVSAALAFSYQDAGFEDALTVGNLDAAEEVPAGGCKSEPAVEHRNAIRQQLSGRDFGVSYTITERDENDKRSTYTAIGNPDALADAAYDNGAMGVSVMVRSHD